MDEGHQSCIDVLGKGKIITLCSCLRTSIWNFKVACSSSDTYILLNNFHLISCGHRHEKLSLKIGNLWCLFKECILASLIKNVFHFQYFIIIESAASVTVAGLWRLMVRFSAVQKRADTHSSSTQPWPAQTMLCMIFSW